VLEYSHVHVARDDLTTAARYMFWLMFRNVASDGLVFDDPVNAGIVSSPGDVYDGDTDALAGDHPWPATTANFAELYYRLAANILSSRTVPADSLAAPFLAQAGITATTASPQDAAAALRAAGDGMLQAIVFHSDHFELSEQFDATTGFEKSVSNLSWSYAAFLSAVRARSLIG
jgi:glucoamylase